MTHEQWEALKAEMRKHGLKAADDAPEDYERSERATKTVIAGFVRVCERGPFKDDPAMYQATGFNIAAKLMMAGYKWARRNKGPEAADAQLAMVLLGIFDNFKDAFGDQYTVTIKRKEKE